jgi:hypothetical protein
MQTEERQAIFRRRKLIERIHAHYRHRGLDRLNARGLIKSPRRQRSGTLSPII